MSFNRSDPDPRRATCSSEPGLDAGTRSFLCRGYSTCYVEIDEDFGMLQAFHTLHCYVNDTFINNIVIIVPYQGGIIA